MALRGSLPSLMMLKDETDKTSPITVINNYYFNHDFGLQELEEVDHEDINEAKILRLQDLNTYI